MGLSRTVSVENQKKIPNPTPRVFCALAKGFPLELGIGIGGQKVEWWD